MKVEKRKDYLSWDEYFMALAKLSAMRSKDPSTQVGACIVSDDNRILSIGYNGAPNGFSDEKFPWSREGENLETKYPYVCHAELNAVLNFRGNKKDLENAKIYVDLFPCNECAKIIIQSGIKEVIYLSDKYANSENNIASRKLFDECSVKYSKIQLKQDKEIMIDLKKLTFMENLTPAMLINKGICPTCYDKEHNNCIYGNNEDKMLYENELFECFLVGKPRADGHTIISSKKHYKDMMEIPDDLCKDVFIFSKKMMRILKEVYSAESVYLCTMCDGLMNHFHIQLIPRYNFEKRGSRNFVKERKEYVEDKEKILKIRTLLKNE